MTSTSIKRLAREQRDLLKEGNRVCEIFATPLEDNIFEWHFTVLGPTSSELFKDGIYHGILRFQRDYPLSPPDILFLTPNGRFETNTKICTSISSFHPELWRPSYSIAFVLHALRLFMGQEEELGLGAIQRTNVKVEKKQQLASSSWDYHCPVCQVTMRELYEKEMKPFPQTSPEEEKEVSGTVKSVSAEKKEPQPGEGAANHNSNNSNNSNDPPQESTTPVEAAETVEPETNPVPTQEEEEGSAVEEAATTANTETALAPPPPPVPRIVLDINGVEVAITVKQIDRWIKVCLFIYVALALIRVGLWLTSVVRGASRKEVS